MRTAGAEGGCARDHLVVEELQLRLAGFAQARKFRRESAVAQFRWNLFRRLDERDENLREHRRVQPARVGNAGDRLSVYLRESLAEEAGRERHRLFVRQGLEQRIADVLLKKAAAF